MNDFTPMRCCSKCNLALPLSAEYFHSSGRGKFSYVCKKCKNQSLRDRRKNDDAFRERGQLILKKSREKHHDKHIAYSRRRYAQKRNDAEWMQQQRTRSNQYRKRNIEAVRERDRDRCLRRWYTQTDHRREIQRRSDKKHADRKKATYKRYHQANADKINLRGRIRYHSNVERERERGRNYYYRNRDKSRVYAKKYRAEHRETCLIRAHRRRARKRSMPDTFTHSQWISCLNYFNQRCAYCGRPRDTNNAIEMEHVIPINSRECRGTVAINIVPSCRACNASKADTPVFEWLTRKFGEQKAEEILKRIQEYFASIEE